MPESQHDHRYSILFRDVASGRAPEGSVAYKNAMAFLEECPDGECAKQLAQLRDEYASQHKKGGGGNWLSRLIGRG